MLTAILNFVIDNFTFQNIIILIIIVIALILPFWIAAIKGRNYAQINANYSKVFFGCIIWFTLSSWTVLIAGREGILLLPIPNIIAIPILLFSTGDFISIPYGLPFKQAYWSLPLLQPLTFYIFYYLSYKKKGKKYN